MSTASGYTFLANKKTQSAIGCEVCLYDKDELGPAVRVWRVGDLSQRTLLVYQTVSGLR